MLIKFTIFLMLAMPVFIHSAEEAKDTRMKDEKMQEKETPDRKGLGLGRKNCFMVRGTGERLCNKRAEKYCMENKEAIECRRFLNIDVSKP